MKTISIRLAGGLGNQLFQLGAALLIASKASYKTIVMDDYALSSYRVARECDLFRFINFSNSGVRIILKRRLLNRFRIPKFFTLKSSFSPFVNDSNFRFIIESRITSRSFLFFKDSSAKRF